MILINKHTKLSRHMESMPIIDRRLIKPVVLIFLAALSSCFRVLMQFIFQTTTKPYLRVPKQASYEISRPLSSNF